jgi:endonuclease/exonuclease/phosphatase family metal-dependent hydrolase
MPSSRSKPHAALLPAALMLALAGCGQETADVPSPRPIVLDGRFDDWAGVPALLADPVDAAAGSQLELTTLQVADDPAWLYLVVSVGRPVNVQAMAGTLHLLVDADADPATGGVLWGMEGVDYSLDLSRMDRPQAGGHGAGFALRPVDSDGPAALRSAYDLRVAGMPTWASDRFELRIWRAGADDGLGRLGRVVRMKLVFAAGPVGEVVQDAAGGAAGPVPAARPVGDETEVAAYTFATQAGPDPLVPTIAPVRSKPGGSVRVAQWNVSEGSFRRPEDHARILGALEPDVLMLDEVYEEISDSALADFFAHPSLAALGEWRWVRSTSGGRQKTVVAARARSIRPAASMERVDHAPDALDSLRGRVPPEAHHMVDQERSAGMSSTGAWVDLGGREVLFVPLDLQSAGYLGSPQDLLRELQARTLHRYVSAEIGTGAERGPVVIGGDFNPVGSATPVDILARGLDVDGSDLTLAEPRRLGQATLATWQDVGAGVFAPGRLDLTLYPDVSIEATGGFVFDTADLTDGQLAELGLDRHLSSVTSDHLVVVTDLRLR